MAKRRGSKGGIKGAVVGVVADVAEAALKSVDDVAGASISAASAIEQKVVAKNLLGNNFSSTVKINPLNGLEQAAELPVASVLRNSKANNVASDAVGKLTQAPRPSGYQSKWNPEANEFQRKMFEKEQMKAGVAIEQKAAAKNLLGNSYPSREAKVNPLNGLPMSSSALPVDDVLKNAHARAQANPAVKEAAQAFINPPKPPEIPGVGGASRSVGSVPRKVAGGLITAWMVQSMFGSRGEQSNAELYNQV